MTMDNQTLPSEPNAPAVVKFEGPTLIERLEKATGPSRELDGLIGRSLETMPTATFETKAPFPSLEGMYWVLGRKDSESGPHEERWSKNPPRYTASIDVALTLVPEGWRWQTSNRAPKPQAGRAFIHNDQPISTGLGGLCPNPKYEGHETTAATPAIALCIAALRARGL